jgi:protein-tyrosine phosphatase
MANHPYSALKAPGGGTLLLTPCPGTKEATIDVALNDLKAAGAQALLTLMTAEELAANQATDLADRCRAAGIEWFFLPVEDDSAPAAAFQVGWEQARTRVFQLLDDDKAVAVHCKGGSGRTGLIVAQILAERGVPVADAVSQVQALRPRAIQLTAHVDYINQLQSSR